MKKIILFSAMLISCHVLLAQRMDVQHKLFALSEKDVYRIYDQMIDSARVSNGYLNPGAMIERFGTGYFNSFVSSDTLLKFEQECAWSIFNEYKCTQFYYPYLSDCLPIDFYGRFIDYLKEVGKRENYYTKKYSTTPLRCIMDILVKQYESGKLSKKDRAKALNWIEQVALSMIKDEHTFIFVLQVHSKYVTDTIRQALINAIENPFYPTKYLDFYMSQQDTTSLDTIGIPSDYKKKYIKSNGLYGYDNEDYYSRLGRFFRYKEMGENLFRGLSPGQAYLKEKRDEFSQKGYLPINTIAEYAYKKHDKQLIQHLKEFKKKHPDYPLKYF